MDEIHILPMKPAMSDQLRVENIREDDFRKYLRRKGKKPSVVDRNVQVLKEFTSFLQLRRGKSVDNVASGDVDVFIQHIEGQRQSAKGFLYVLMNYFQFLGERELLQHARALRNERTEKTRRSFLIKEFLKINHKHVEKLASIGIKNVDQMLENGRTKNLREQLSRQLDIPEEAILELVRLSDITRIGYVKKKLSRLYYDAGLHSPAKIATFQPEQLHEFFVKFIADTGWDGMVPNPKDLVNNIRNARKLSKIVED